MVIEGVKIDLHILQSLIDMRYQNARFLEILSFSNTHVLTPNGKNDGYNMGYVTDEHFP